MKPKKTKKADLNNYSNTFILIGMVVVLLFALKAINMKMYSAPIEKDIITFNKSTDEETTVVQVEKIKTKIKPIVKRELVDLKIEKDDSKIQEDIFKNSEPVDSIPEIIDSIETAEVEDIDISFPVSLVQNVPVFPGCEGKKGKALKKCLNDKIGKFVGRNFNTELAQELGLSGEKVKITTEFTIDKNGNVTDIKARSRYKDLAKEGKRILAKLPRMKPGSQNGRNVRVIYTLPIVFKVAEE